MDSKRPLANPTFELKSGRQVDGERATTMVNADPIEPFIDTTETYSTADGPCQSKATHGAYNSVHGVSRMTVQMPFETDSM
jgi:hypothetical protein